MSCLSSDTGLYRLVLIHKCFAFLFHHPFHHRSYQVMYYFYLQIHHTTMIWHHRIRQFKPFQFFCNDLFPLRHCVIFCPVLSHDTSTNNGRYVESHSTFTYQARKQRDFVWLPDIIPLGTEHFRCVRYLKVDVTILFHTQSIITLHGFPMNGTSMTVDDVASDRNLGDYLQKHQTILIWE